MDERLKTISIKNYEEKMNLEDCLTGHTKVKLGEIGSKWGSKLPQSERKSEMVEKLVPVIKSGVIKYFGDDGKDFSDDVHEIVVSEGRPAVPEDADKYMELFERGLLFIGKKDGEPWLFMPSDTSAIFETGRLDSSEQSRESLMFSGDPVHKEADTDRTEEESEVITYAAALSHMYGIYERGQIGDVWELNHGRRLPLHRIEAAMEKAGDSDGFYTRDKYVIAGELADPEDYCNLIDRIVPADSYYYPNKDEIDKFKDGPVMNNDIHKYYLRNFLARMLGMDVPVIGDDEKLDSIMEKLAFDARLDNTIQQVMSTLRDNGINITEGEDQSRFIDLYIAWLYGMRIWACKGYKPVDLPPGMMVLHNVKMPYSVDPKSEVKVGRNDPCPCGSGKKYKKCCAKCI